MAALATTMGMILTYRILQEYSEKEKRKLLSEKTELDSQIEQNELNEISTIYPQQQCCGLTVQAIFNHYPRKIVNILVYAWTQVGKTGAMISICQEYMNYSKISKHNIYIITGHSSKAWKKQTKNRFPACLEKNIYHRPDFGKKGTKNKLVKEISGKKNVLFIMDEVHVAAGKGQSMDSLFKKLKFNDLQYCLRNDIKIVEFSATPDGTVYDLYEWGPHAKTVKIKPGEGYVGAFKLLEQERVSQFKDLCCFNNTTGTYNEQRARENISEIIPILEQYNNPLYHIIRTPHTEHQNKVKDHFKNLVFRDKDYDYINYDGETKKSKDVTGINDILCKKPKKHTFIFIKEMLRMAVTLEKKHLGILYERYTKSPNDSTIIQGLVGRATGYDDNKQTHIFTNIDSIIKYKRLWDSDFDPNQEGLWKSNTTKSNKNGGTESKGTHICPSNYVNNNVEEIEEFELHYRKFCSEKEAREYYKIIKKNEIYFDMRERMVKRKTIKTVENKEFYTDSLSENTNSDSINSVRSVKDVEARLKRNLRRKYYKNGEIKFAKTTWCWGYDNPPRLNSNKKLQGGDNKTLKIYIPIYIKNEYSDNSDMLEYLNKLDIKFGLTKYTTTSVRQKN